MPLEPNEEKEWLKVFEDQLLISTVSEETLDKFASMVELERLSSETNESLRARITDKVFMRGRRGVPEPGPSRYDLIKNQT